MSGEAVFCWCVGGPTHQRLNRCCVSWRRSPARRGIGLTVYSSSLRPGLTRRSGPSLRSGPPSDRADGAFGLPLG